MNATSPVAGIVLYSTALCPYCILAKRLLADKGVPFTEIRVDGNHERRQEMISRCRRFTVPQIFIGERHVGGFDDLYRLECTGELNALLDHVQEGRPHE